MTIEHKIGKTLSELRVQDEGGVRALFEEVWSGIESERRSAVLAGASSEAEREQLARALRDRWLARKHGILAQVDEYWLKLAPRELKPAVGREFNRLRQAIPELEVEALVRSIPLRSAKSTSIASAPDLTLPGLRPELGSIHPVTRVQREIEDIFLGLGFRIETGPEIESVYYNFDALNIPESHPSRDDWDTLYIDADTLLRTHTSPVQIRAMRKYGAPLYIVTPGKCYRHDNPDATHSPMFHQCEGLAVDTDITFADLKGTLDFFAKKFFGEKTRTRFQPSFFPFTEPSGEVAASCPFCEGRGCRTCKESGWIELMGCGMVHPDVLRHGGIDPERYSGWAFGLGIDRFAMLKYDIGEIQHFFQSDVRFLEQF
ncbi:MAG TPA: phenylalanine--tRNA ligase subunit alpha [Terriglobia bacterium]|nr:phenylalanine--tRNA ligase subunit alpha [Terriglobia bacterium]